ncbi:MAG: MerR family transcriptional regulator [Anaerolineales bacterium]|nr:MerR family transcriptional regulator [Anaerolineales bacterium]
MLTKQELCQQAGLKRSELQQLGTAGLLNPTQRNPDRYRPKLVSWGKKLAYLLEIGWEIDEIKTWSQERWAWPNPRIWPPPKPGTVGDLKNKELPQGRG